MGRSNTSLTPAAFCLKNLLFCALSWAQAESNDVVSWSTRWVYLVRPDRPKFLTWWGGEINLSNDYDRSINKITVKVRVCLRGSDKANLHDFGQDSFVEMILQSRCAEVSLVHVFLFIL